MTYNRNKDDQGQGQGQGHNDRTSDSDNGIKDMGCQSSIRVISLNCWGLKFLSKHRKARLAEIGAQLAIADPQPDIIGLQECWTQEDFTAIRNKTKAVLPYGKYYHSGVFGGGLAILSRWPIQESNMYRYPLNGRPTAFFRGDWFVGKGVACAKIKIGPNPTNDVVEVFCTHLHAPYEREPNDSYICHRTAQAWEIAKLMRRAVDSGHLVLGLGDFNMIPSSLAYSLIEKHGGVLDSWKVLHPDAAVGAAEDEMEIARARPVPTVEFNSTENGATCDSAYNTWRWNKASQRRLDRGEEIIISNDVPDPRGKRLDYVFYANGAYRSLSAPKWKVKDANVGMMMRHPTLRCSLSDHFSVEVTLTTRSDGISRSEDLVSSAASEDSSHPINGPPGLLAVSTYDKILAMIDKYTTRETRQRRLRLGHLVFSIVVFLALLVAIWWSPHNYVAFILMLVSTLGLSAGVIDGLIGGLFVGSELRALREFEWEIRNARETAENQSEEQTKHERTNMGRLL